MDPLPHFESLMINDSVIDDVIANMSGAFEKNGVDQSTLQKLKQLWRSKVQKSLQKDPTDAVSKVDADSADTTKEHAKEEVVAVKQSLDDVTNKSATVDGTGGVQLGINWELYEMDKPEFGSSPREQRRNMTFGNAMQLDGELSPTTDESSEEEDAEMPEAEASSSDDDEESLNSNDDLSGEEAAGGDLFDSVNVIACQFNKVTHLREKWKFELCDGVMMLNGKDYVFKEMTGEAYF